MPWKHNRPPAIAGQLGKASQGFFNLITVLLLADDMVAHLVEAIAADH